jgi:NAD(P)-dependent dehydrogenase (short-subunit alcohol dehydrogenase family)
MAMDPLLDFTDHVVLVTGGGRGLGYQMVRAFAERGADVVVASRKLDNCERVASEVRGLGRRALAVQVHVAKWESIDQLLTRAYDTFGRIDILVNNAGLAPEMPSHDVTEALFNSVVGVNFKGPFRLSSLVARQMAMTHGGSILNISSIGAVFPRPRVVPYTASKAALNAMTRALAAEYGPSVRVNALLPGHFLTDMTQAWPEEKRKVVNNAAQRAAQPSEIIGAALFLSSPASTFATGVLLRLDGGLPIAAE